MEKIRFGGLASGMDTESIVKKLMEAERVRVDTVKAKKQRLTWKQELYRDTNTALSSVQDSVNKMRWSGNWSKIKVTSSNEQAVSVTNSGVSNGGTHTIEATRLAEYAQLFAAPGSADNSLIGSSITDTTNTLQVDAAGKSMTINLGGVEQTITLTAAAGQTSTTYSLAQVATELQTKIDAAFGRYVNPNDSSQTKSKILVSIDGGNKLKLTADKSYVAGSSEPRIAVKGFGTDTELLTKLGLTENQSNRIELSTTLDKLQERLGPPPGTQDINITINGQTIKMEKTKTLGELLYEVNNSTAGVKMSYDNHSQTFSFVSKSSGADAVISLGEGMTNNFLSKLGFTTTNRSDSGVDAQFKLDGITMARNSNTFTIDGMTYNIKKRDEPVTVNAQWDTEAIFTQVKEFMDKYNETIEKVNKRLDEKTYRSFQPLTEEQKKDMKEKEIELWEEKAKSGLLKNDSYLSSALQSIRTALYEPVNGLSGFNHLAQIGIETSKDYKAQGKLVFKDNDETKLRDAIAKDPEGIAKLFSAKSTKDSLPRPSNTSDPGYQLYLDREKEIYQESGLAVRLFKRIDQAISDVKLRIDNKGYETENDSSIAKEIKGIDSRLLRMEELLKEKEDRYYKQFTAMEKAMSKYNSQSSWLSSQLGMGQQ